VHRLAVPRGGTVVAEVWGDGPVVYLVHGWGGWRGQLGAFVAPLVEAGYRVVAADAPSHGDSGDGFLGTRRGTVMEMIETLEVVGREFGPGVGVVAHSLGCTVAGQVVAGGLQVERLVLIAPNHGFQDVLDQFVRVLRLSRRTADHLRDELEGITQRPLSAFDLDALGADGSMPDTLVVHDRADKETPYQVGAALAEAWPNACLVSTDGLGHQRILADAETVAITVGHITERVPAPERSRTQR
jgi:pimeloyl-ACP methyl ester carboxylesterase